MNKKVIIPMLIATITLVSLIIGATYAYYLAGISYETYTTSINANTDPVSSISLEAGTSLNLKLSAEDMMRQLNNVTYYATADGSPTTSENIVPIGVAKAVSSGTYSCAYTLNVTYSGNMKEAIPGEGSVILNVNGEDYDLYLTSFPTKINGRLIGLTSTDNKTINGSLRVINLSGTDQSAMANTNMTLTFTADEFECTSGTGMTVKEYLAANTPHGYNTSIEGGMYRFQGQQTDSEGKTIDNYICFGTTNMEKCLSDEEHYMYRIIGVTEDGRLKLIKKTSIGEYQWWTDFTTNVPWYQETGNRSKLYTALNGSDFLGNNEYVPSGWDELIADTSWKYGDFTNINQAASAIYATEEALTNKVTSKIGLMYVADYYYSQQAGGKNCAYEQGEAVYSTCTYGWMHLKQNDTDLPADNSSNAYSPSAEWTMSRYGWYSASSVYAAWYVGASGNLKNVRVTYALSVRPVFYLNANMGILDGNGKMDSPFTILPL